MSLLNNVSVVGESVDESLTTFSVRRFYDIFVPHDRLGVVVIAVDVAVADVRRFLELSVNVEYVLASLLFL